MHHQRARPARELDEAELRVADGAEEARPEVALAAGQLIAPLPPRREEPLLLSGRDNEELDLHDPAAPLGRPILVDDLVAVPRSDADIGERCVAAEGLIDDGASRRRLVMHGDGGHGETLPADGLRSARGVDGEQRGRERLYAAATRRASSTRPPNGEL